VNGKIGKEKLQEVPASEVLQSFMRVGDFSANRNFLEEKSFILPDMPNGKFSGAVYDMVEIKRQNRVLWM